MSSDTRYFPPTIDEGWLNNRMFERYPAHKTSPLGHDLIERLTQEYLKFWRLIVSFPDRRVVAPATILAVQSVHYADRERYFTDCMDYFRRFRAKDLCWLGRTDFLGTIDTVRAYNLLYKEDPPEQWHDLMTEYNLGRPALRLV